MSAKDLIEDVARDETIALYWDRVYGRLMPRSPDYRDGLAGGERTNEYWERRCSRYEEPTNGL